MIGGPGDRPARGRGERVRLADTGTACPPDFARSDAGHDNVTWSDVLDRLPAVRREHRCSCCEAVTVSRRPQSIYITWRRCPDQYGLRTVRPLHLRSTWSARKEADLWVQREEARWSFHTGFHDIAESRADDAASAAGVASHPLSEVPRRALGLPTATAAGEDEDRPVAVRRGLVGLEWWAAFRRPFGGVEDVGCEVEGVEGGGHSLASQSSMLSIRRSADRSIPSSV